MARGPTAQGEQTREAIVRAAADVASVHGLEGLTIRTLAGELHMSASGLYAHFRSKESLQLATIEAARAVYVAEVIAAPLETAAGVARLVALCDSFLSYVERRVFPGGCFFAAAMAEFDSRPGPVRDRIAQLQAEWLETLRRAAADAVAAGELNEEADLEQLAFDLEAALLSANWYLHLFGDTRYVERGRRSVRERIARDARRPIDAA